MEIPSEDPFYQSLPNRPWCADFARGTAIGHRVSLEMRDRADAVLRPFIQINPPGIYRHMAVGISGDPFSWEDARLPEPSLSVVSGNRLDAQFIWTLKSPVTASRNGRKGPQEYAFRVSRAIAERLDGKVVMPRDSRAVVMNPFYPGFLRFRSDQTYTLDQLGEALLEDFRPRQRVPELRRVPNREREKALFGVVRFHAYGRVRLFRSEAALAEHLFNFAGVANFSFQRPLDGRVIAKMAGAVAAWTWEHRTGIDRRNRGASRVVPIPSFVTGEQRARLRTDHKRAGALYSAQAKVRSTVRKIRGAITRPTLDDEPHDLGISKLSEETGLHRNTIRPVIEQLKPLLKPSPSLSSILVVRLHPTVSEYPPKCASKDYALRIVWDKPSPRPVLAPTAVSVYPPKCAAPTVSEYPPNSPPPAAPRKPPLKVRKLRPDERDPELNAQLWREWEQWRAKKFGTATTERIIKQGDAGGYGFGLRGTEQDREKDCGRIP